MAELVYSFICWILTKLTILRKKLKQAQCSFIWFDFAKKIYWWFVTLNIELSWSIKYLNIWVFPTVKNHCMTKFVELNIKKYSIQNHQATFWGESLFWPTDTYCKQQHQLTWPPPLKCCLVLLRTCKLHIILYTQVFHIKSVEIAFEGIIFLLVFQTDKWTILIHTAPQGRFGDFGLNIFLYLAPQT